MEPTTSPHPLRPADLDGPVLGAVRPSPWTDVVDRFRSGTLCRSEWTHEAHLAVCRATLDDDADLDAATAELCERITAYNAVCELPPGRVACHVTITRYFVEAVARSGVSDVEALSRHPWCDRRAPLRHWSRAALESDTARGAWLAPDVAPLPWRDG